MKTILLWDMRFPDRRPVRLTVEDTVASAAVRAGVAAAANPAEAGALAAGGPLDSGALVEVVLQHGASNSTRRVFVPSSVAQVGAAAGVLAVVGKPIAGGVTPTPTPTPTLQAITSRNFWNTGPGGTTVTGTVKQLSRVGYWIGQGDVSEVSVMLTSYYSNDMIGPAFTARCDFEYNGVCVPFNWDNGTTTRVIASGDHDVVAASIPATAFGVSKIPAGARVFVKLEREFDLGVGPPYVGTRLPQTGDTCMRGPTGSTSKIGVAGVPDTSGGYVSYDVLIVPTIVLGKPVTTMPAVMTVGASIEAGTGDDNNRGYTNRATSTFPYVAGTNLATSSESAVQFVATAGKRMSCAKYHNIGLNGFGGNDYSQAKAKEQAATALAQVNAAYKALGIKKIGQMRMSPKSDTSDAFATLAGQTVRSSPIDFNTYRAYVDAQAQADPNVNLLIDTTAGSEPAGVPGKWQVNGTANYPTNDGTHPNTPIHAQMAPYARAGIDTLIGQL